VTIDLKTTRPDGTPRTVPLTDDDVARGRVLVRWMRVALVVGIVVSLGLVVFVWTQVPVWTTTPYRRHGVEHSLPTFALLLFPGLGVGMLASTLRKSSAYVPPRERTFLLVAMPIFVVFIVGATAYLASTYLAAGASS